jgi:hypothetical protein
MIVGVHGLLYLLHGVKDNGWIAGVMERDGVTLCVEYGFYGR